MIIRVGRKTHGHVISSRVREPSKTDFHLKFDSDETEIVQVCVINENT